MLFSNMLIRKVVLLRKLLIPTAVLAGFIVLALRESGLLPIRVEFLEITTYHTIALGFIAMGLRVPDKKDAGSRRELTGAKSGALIVGSYLIQGIVGLIISAGLSFTLMPHLFKAAGILLPMGYGQGPGQANNVGSTYEQLGFAGGQSFALSLAAAGYLCACVVGIIYLNVLRRKNLIHVQTPGFVSGSISTDTYQMESEIRVSESVDRFSVQAALVILVYLATYLIIRGITSLLSAAAPGPPICSILCSGGLTSSSAPCLPCSAAFYSAG
jgi:ESS family glutamate:Na+ symporter